MKTTILFTALIVLNQICLCQNYFGYYIDNAGIKKEVVFNIEPTLFSNEPNYETILTRVFFTVNNHREKLYPDMCKSFRFSVNNEEVIFLSLPNLMGEYFHAPKGIFLRPKILGPTNLYYYYYSNKASTLPIVRIRQDWIISKNDSTSLVITYGGARRKDLARFFHDYAEMAEMILNKETSGAIIQDIEKLVTDYNIWKLNQK